LQDFCEGEVFSGTYWATGFDADYVSYSTEFALIVHQIVFSDVEHLRLAGEQLWRDLFVDWVESSSGDTDFYCLGH
jgi:hypothetical protein